MVLSIVMGIPVSDDKPHVPIAFKSVQLISNEFLSCLNLDCLTLYVTTVGCYGLQTADMNISLTAINLLWSISDFIAKEHVNYQEKRLGKSTISVDKFVDGIMKDAIETAIDKQLGINSPILSEESFESLWIGVFNELRQLGTDSRYFL